MKHCTLPTLLAVKTTILPTVSSSRAGQKRQKLWRLVKCVLSGIQNGVLWRFESILDILLCTPNPVEGHIFVRRT